MILLIDNYDSFSYNLYQLIGSIRQDITVIRNDVATVDEIAAMAPEAIILSPGPGRPEAAGICTEVVRQLGSRIPILGVCLGHQAIGVAYGATVTHASRLMHGKSSPITYTSDDPLFTGLPQTPTVARYHSLSIAPDTLGDDLIPIAHAADDGEIMAVRHRKYPVVGFQFHPESILTPDGQTLIYNFLKEIKTND